MAELPPAATPIGSGYTGSVAATQLAGFWRRFAAYIIDALIVGVSGSIVQSILAAIIGASGSDMAGTTWRGGLISLFLGLVYFGYLWARNGQSLGYMALGLRLVKTDGSPVSFGLGMFRYLVIYLSFLVCAVPALISAFMIGMSEQKQGLHDRVAGTIVVRA